MATREAEFLLVNNNNTRTKFAPASRDELFEERSLPSRGLEAAAVRELLHDWNCSTAVVLASVVPANVPALLEAFAGREVLRVGHGVRLGVEIDFPDPAGIGADRLANASAAAEGAPLARPVVVVDFGTAVTFDIVDRRPAYVGGVIAPGLDAMRHYLHERTALLPIIDLERPARVVGRSTVEAMRSGAFHGYRGLVREILARIDEETGERAKTIATGGYAAFVAADFPEIEEIDPLLTMRGLLRIARLNFPA